LRKSLEQKRFGKIEAIDRASGPFLVLFCFPAVVWRDFSKAFLLKELRKIAPLNCRF
jgi:hypothetical protein